MSDGLRALADKMEHAHKTSCADFDWSLRPRLPLLVPRTTVVRAVSHFLNGERIAERVCSVLRTRLPDAAARGFLEMQRDDEARHAELYGRYLKALGGAAPPDTALVSAADRALQWRGAPEAIVLACHVLLETEAMRFNGAMERWVPCPLLGAIATSVARDEARHVAFGREYLRESLPALTVAERRAIYGWLKALWYDMAAGAFDVVVWTPVPRRQRRAYLDAQWSRRADWLASAGLTRAEEIRR